MHTSNSDTEELLKRSAGGDDSAVRELFVRNQDRLRKMVEFRMDDRLQSRFDPSDVVQESLIEASDRLPEYLAERPLPFYPWLRQIAWERLIALQRRHLRAGVRTVTREAPFRVSDESVGILAQRFVASGSSPSQQVVRQEIRDRVRSALEELSSDDRELLLMRHLEQLRVSEIAAVLGLTEAAVKSRLRRSLERLQGRLGSEFREATR